MNTDTICALATANGNASIAVIRVSGSKALTIAKQVTQQVLKPRYAHLAGFLNQNGELIDQGIAIFFPAPNSFTGEDCLELQPHGNVHVCHALLTRLHELGARPALAGEFSERAFLNAKLDLTQLEAIADLIASGSEQAAKAAVQSMQGRFSQQVDKVLQQLIEVRTHIEASLDFSEQDIETETRSQAGGKLTALNHALQTLQASAQQGLVLQQGATVVLSGPPNVGKSSLFNSLCREGRAIVTDIAGTTRDIVSADIQLDGLPVRLLDTAGIRNRDEADSVEQEGMLRAQAALAGADVIIQVYPPGKVNQPPICDHEKTINVINKADLLEETNKNASQAARRPVLSVSAKTGQGLARLRAEIIRRLHLQPENQQTPFSARRRHLQALQKCRSRLAKAQQHIQNHAPLELVAEECRLAQQLLAEITGQFTPDDLLDHIFREFCIGK